MGARLKKTGAWPSVALAAAVLALYVGERILAGTGRTVLDVIAATLAAVAVAGRAYAWAVADRGHRPLENRLSVFTAIGLSGLLAYAASCWTGGDVSTVLSRAWLVVFACGAVPLTMIEVAAWPMRRAPRAETARLDEAAAGGLSLALAAAFLFAAYYLAGQHDIQADYSYFRTARPGQATLDMVARLEGELEVHLFFPRANEVLQEVREYLAPIESRSENVRVSVDDRFLEPDLARRFRVRRDGVMVLASGDRHEKIDIGVNLKSARRTLRKLDREFAQRFAKVTRPRLTAYRTTGHGEAGSGDRDDPRSIRGLERILQVAGYKTAPLGLRQGLGRKIPDDAALVIVAGPMEPFLPEEVNALVEYMDRGGKLLLTLDPGTRTDLSPLLSSMGLEFKPGVLVNDRVHLARNHDKADRALLVTASFSSHPTVDSVLKGNLPVVLVNAGSLARHPGPGKSRVLRFPVRSLSGTWRDMDGDFEYDKDEETRGTQNLMAVASATRRAEDGKEADGEKKGMKAVVLSDTEVLTDSLLANAGNLYLASDIVRWLADIEGVRGAVESGDDVPVLHTRDQDKMWFYGSVAVVPLLILALGLGVVGFKRRRTER